MSAVHYIHIIEPCSCIITMMKWRESGLVVECQSTDPKAVGSDPSCAEIGLHDFYNPPNV